MSRFFDPELSGGSQSSPLSPQAKKQAKDFPAILELLVGAEDQWDDPSFQPGAITLFIRDGDLVAMLNLKNWKRIAFVQVDDWQKIWFALEGAIQTKSVTWKPSKQ